MRQVSLSPFMPEDDSGKLQWLVDSVREIERASIDGDVGTIANAFKVLNLPAAGVRTLDVSTATLGDLVAFVGTFISDLKKGGTNRGV